MGRELKETRLLRGLTYLPRGSFAMIDFTIEVLTAV
jgi:hypothetical protein